MFSVADLTYENLTQLQHEFYKCHKDKAESRKHKIKDRDDEDGIEGYDDDIGWCDSCDIVVTAGDVEVEAPCLHRS